MCSRKCDTPETSAVSSREPVRTKKPDSHRAGGRIAFADDVQAIGEDVMMKLQLVELNQ